VARPITTMIEPPPQRGSWEGSGWWRGCRPFRSSPRKRGPRGHNTFTRVFNALCTRASLRLGPASAGANGECCSARAHIFSFQTAIRLGIWLKAKEYRPLFICAGPGGRPHYLSFCFPQSRGSARRQGAVPGWGPGDVRQRPDLVHIGAPAPCGAPTRHLGLYAFDGGRTGPTPSGRRGCPSTARGRGLRPPLAGAAPVPRLANASGRRPSYLDRDAGYIVFISLFVKCFSVKIS
jgi:hypothetical protein